MTDSSGPGKQSLEILTRGFGSIMSGKGADLPSKPEPRRGSETAPPSPSTRDKDLANHWFDELAQARKREERYRKEAKKLIRLYEAEDSKLYQFNILYSNTETLLPALYNLSPRPVIRRRYNDDDSTGMAVKQVLERALQYFQDPGSEDYFTFDELMTSAVVGALVPGRGVTWFKYTAQIDTTDEAAPSVQYETVCGEPVSWDKIHLGFAPRWRDVPWVCREHDMTRQELVDNFGPAVGNAVLLGRSEEAVKDPAAPMDGYPDTARVYEIWDKSKRQVLFVSEGYRDGLLKRPVADPFQLSGFFPLPKPLQLVERVSSLVPVPLYKLYEEQAKELNKITTRINKIVDALKVRGAYDAQITELSRVLELDDNKLVPVENVAALLANGGKLENAIMTLPIEKLVTVLQQLILAREQCKQVIYEITGIADILRGASVASETATAQNIKSQWGTIRLKRFQKEVARYARDCLRIMAELSGKHLSQETLQSLTMLQFPSAEEKAQAQQLMTLAQAAPELAQAAPPEMQQQVAAVLSQPSWDEVLHILQSNWLRQYHLDVETNSTVDVEATEDKANIVEFLNALGQFLGGAAPVVEQGLLPFDAAKSIMLAITKRFRFGEEVERELAKMQPPQPTAGPDPAALEAQAKEIETGRAELQKHSEQIKAEQSKLKEQAMELDFRKKEAMLELGMKQKELQAHAKTAVQSLQLTHQGNQQELAHGQRMGQLDDADRKRQLSVQESTMQQKQEAAQAKQQDTGIQQIISVVQQLGQQLQATQQGLQQVAEQVQQLAAGRDEPVELAYGGDGKVASIRRGGKDRPVKRDPNGKLVGF